MVGKVAHGIGVGMFEGFHTYTSMLVSYEHLFHHQ